MGRKIFERIRSEDSKSIGRMENIRYKKRWIKYGNGGDGKVNKRDDYSDGKRRGGRKIRKEYYNGNVNNNGRNSKRRIDGVKNGRIVR